MGFCLFGDLTFCKYYVPLLFHFCRESMYVCIFLCMYVYGHHISSEGKDQPGKVASPTRGQLNRKT